MRKIFIISFVLIVYNCESIKLKEQVLYDKYEQSVTLENNSQVLVNCASNEYFNAVHTDSLSLKVITPIFMDRKNGKEKIISFYAKKARGSMAKFIIQNRITELDILKSFNVGGYSFQSDQSDETKWFYTREHPVN